MTAAPESRGRRRWLVGRAAAICTAAFLLAAGVDYRGYPYGAPLPGIAGDRGENGLWLHHRWYDGSWNAADEAALAARLRANGIRYAYVHVRSVDRNGRLRYHEAASARALLAALHRDAPGVRIYAWIYAGNAHGRGRVDLADPNVRRTMAAEARWLATDCGFDGVQWDYEICHDGEPGLPALLEETRRALPPGKQIGVATALWGPQPFPAAGLGWTDGYFERIAARCDQLAVMDYDTGLYLPRSYVWLTAAEVRHACRAAAAANPRCRILIGVPTYVAGGASHRAAVENVRLALRGVRQGLTELTPDERRTFAGIAPFAAYTTTDADWAAYRNGWLRR